MAKSDQFTFRVRPELRAAFEDYLKSHEFTPVMGDVLTKALEEFLERKGFLPPSAPALEPAPEPPAADQRRPPKGKA